MAVRQVELTRRLKSILDKLVRIQKTPRAVAQRAQIILDLDLGCSPTRVAELNGLARSGVYRWRDRWRQQVGELIAAEQAGAKEHLLVEKVCEALTDAARSGAPPQIHARTAYADPCSGL